MDILSAVSPALRSSWDGAIASLIDYDDLHAVWGQIFDVLAQSLEISSLSVIAYLPDQVPHIIHSQANEDPVADRIGAYVSGAYLLDPFYRACVKSEIGGVQLLADIAPSDFEESQYFRTFFSRFGLCDEVNVIHRTEDGVVLALSLGRPAGARKFSPTTLLKLEGLAGQIVAICECSYRNTSTPTGHRDASKVFHNRLKAAMVNFGTSILTPREKEVLDHLLRGYSVKSAAENLGVSAGTVRIHRHSIYEKLDVGTQTELFALILECLRLTTDDLSEDPLKHMMPPVH